jgi:hypothetical protein
MRSIVRSLIVVGCLTLLGAGIATSEDCSAWPNHTKQGESVSAKKMLDEIRGIAKDALKKGGSCESAGASEKDCRRHWTAVLGAARRCEKDGDTWQVACDTQWDSVKEALEAAKVAKPTACFAALDYKKGS